MKNSYELKVILLRSGGLSSDGLGPLNSDDAVVGVLVRIHKQCFSSYLVVGRRQIPLGVPTTATLHMANGSLDQGDQVELYDGANLIGTASVVSIN